MFQLNLEGMGEISSFITSLAMILIGSAFLIGFAVKKMLHLIKG